MDIRIECQWLVNEVMSYIDAEDIANKVSRKVQKEMAISLSNFIVNATRKFIAGQKEHGGDIRDRDLDKEISQEQIDLFWYLSAKQWPKKSL